MRPPVLTGPRGGAIALALTMLLAAGIAADAGARTYFPGYPEAGAPMVQRPHGLKVGSGTGWSELRWRSWGSAEAVADGHFYDHPGLPGGAEGAGTLTLSGPVRCGPHRVYTQAVGALSDGRQDTLASEPLTFRPQTCRLAFPANMAQLDPQDVVGSMVFRPHPRQIALTLDSGFVGLRWTSWGEGRAVARGTALWSPYCSGQTRRCEHRAAARVTLSHLGWCGSVPTYRHIAFPGASAVLHERARDLDDYDCG